MRIGWSTWEPGVTADGSLSPAQSSYNGASWTAYLFDQFRREGHDVVMLQWANDSGLVKQSVEEALSVDVAVICWRWAMPDYPERHLSYLWQNELIKMLGEAGIPMMVHDQDHKMTDIDRRWLKQYNVIITAPQFVLEGDYPADASLFFCNPFEQMPLRLWGTEDVDFVYVGNNYERFEQTVRYVGPVSERYKTILYGNWLAKGPNRESPEYVRYKLPKVIFPGRLPQSKVLEVLSNAKTTMHLAKNSYAKHGFITLRWAEAAAANVIAFIPNEFYLPPKYRQKFEQFGLAPRDGEELADAIKRIEKEQLAPEILDFQRQFVKEFMTTEQWFDVLEKLQERRK